MFNLAKWLTKDIWASGKKPECKGGYVLTEAFGNVCKDKLNLQAPEGSDEHAGQVYDELAAEWVTPRELRRRERVRARDAESTDEPSAAPRIQAPRGPELITPDEAEQRVAAALNNAAALHAFLTNPDTAGVRVMVPPAQARGIDVGAFLARRAQPAVDRAGEYRTAAALVVVALAVSVIGALVLRRF